VILRESAHNGRKKLRGAKENGGVAQKQCKPDHRIERRGVKKGRWGSFHKDMHSCVENLTEKKFLV
jgi:hypothetical protein